MIYLCLAVTALPGTSNRSAQDNQDWAYDKVDRRRNEFELEESHTAGNDDEKPKNTLTRVATFLGCPRCL